MNLWVYECVDKTFNQWTFSPAIVATLHDSKLYDTFVLFFSSFVHRLKWGKVNTSHHIALVIHIESYRCAPRRYEQHELSTSMWIRNVFLTFTVHTFSFFCACARCVWHTRRKIAQTHNRTSRKMGKKHHQQQDFFLFFMHNSCTNNTIAILESWKYKRKKSENDRSVI